MKKALLVAVLLCATFSYAQRGGSNSPASSTPSVGPNSAPRTTPGAYDPKPVPAGMDAPPPIEQSPKDAFIHDSKLAAKLQKLLPDGPSIQEACDGFKKLGDCVSAIHASQNVGIPLADLKAKVTGKGSESLDQAIHELKPDADAKAEKKKAWKQAEKEIPVSN